MTPGERFVQEQRLERGSSRTGTAAHGYSAMRWAQSMGMPHGRVVGGP